MAQKTVKGIKYVNVTIKDIQEAKHNTIFHFFQNGEVKNCRVSGECRRWKREPKRVHLPVKVGLYQNHYINNSNMYLIYKVT